MSSGTPQLINIQVTLPGNVEAPAEPPQHPDDTGEASSLEAGTPYTRPAVQPSLRSPGGCACQCGSETGGGSGKGG